MIPQCVKLRVEYVSEENGIAYGGRVPSPRQCYGSQNDAPS